MTDAEFLERCDNLSATLVISFFKKWKHKGLREDMAKELKACLWREYLRGRLINKGCRMDIQKDVFLISTLADFDDDAAGFFIGKDGNSALIAAAEAVLDKEQGDG